MPLTWIEDISQGDVIERDDVYELQTQIDYFSSNRCPSYNSGDDTSENSGNEATDNTAQETGAHDGHDSTDNTAQETGANDGHKTTNNTSQETSAKNGHKTTNNTNENTDFEITDDMLFMFKLDTGDDYGLL